MTINVYMLIINNFLNKKLTIVDNLVFLFMMLFIYTIISYVYVSRKTKNLYQTIKQKLTNTNNLKYFLIVSFPISFLSLIGIVDSSIGIINLIQIILNMLVYYCTKILKKENINKFYVILLIISNIILGSMLSFSGTIKYGPIGVISSIVSVVLNQILNFLYEKNSKENNLQNKSVTNNYEEGFVAWGLGEVIYIFPIMIIGLIIEKVDWYFYIKNLYIPFFMSFLLAPYRMEAYGLKNYARDEYGVIANICSLVVTVISVFITPLFDNTTNNTSLTYYSVFPLITSIICNKLINNPGYIKQIWNFSFGKQNKVTCELVEVTLNNLD